jgi:hypothetical protein
MLNEVALSDITMKLNQIGNSYQKSIILTARMNYAKPLIHDLFFD